MTEETLSKLDVINSMLATKGIKALTAVDTQHPEYQKAIRTYDAVNVEWQGKGWWFNQTDQTISPTTGDEIVFSADVLHIDPTDTGKRYVKRKLRLFDMTTSSFTITEAVKCHIVRLVEYEDLPPEAQAYLRAKARYEYFLDQDGVEPKLGRYERALALAWEFFKSADLKNSDLNFFEGGHALWFQTQFHPSQANRAVARQPT